MLQKVLSQVIRDQGLSSRKAAGQIGVSHSTILRVLRGDPFDVATLVSIANWLHVRPATLLDTLGDDPLEAQIATLLERLPELANVLEKAATMVENGEASPAIMEDIVSYANYKLSLAGDKVGSGQSIGGVITQGT